MAVSFLVQGAGGQKTSPFSPEFALSAVVLEPVLNTVFMLFTLALVYASARLLGGRANYAVQSQAVSQVFMGWMSILALFMVAISLLLLIASPFSPYTTIGTIVSFLTGIPILLLFAASFLVFLYGLYKIYLAIRAVHNLSTIRAAAVVLVTVAFVVLLNILLISIAGPAPK